MKAPTFLQTIFLFSVSYWQYTDYPEYAGRLWAIDPYKNPVAPRYMLTLYLPSIGEV